MEKYEVIENMIKESSPTIYKAFQLLEETKQRAVFSVYAFCHTVDDAIDAAKDLSKLNQLKTQLKATFEGDAPDDPIFLALKETITTFPTDIDPYLDLIDGVRDDFYNKPIETEDDLEKYCYKVAGTIGLMLVPIVASQAAKDSNKKIKDVAIELGKAMQITTILRDIRNDLMKDRVYIADDVIEKQQLELEITRTGLVTPEWQSTVEYYIAKARDKYKVFYENADLFDEDAIYPTYLAAAFYEGILDKIQKKNYTNINKRHEVSAISRFFITKKVKHTLNKKGLIK